MLHTTYFGPISWYRELTKALAEPASLGAVLCHEAMPLDTIISSSEHYVKQTTRNHCRIATANGVQKLTVPVNVPTKLGCPIRDVRVSDHGNWRHQHWEALCSAYGMSPFFDYYADDIRPFYERRWDFLYDYNMEATAKVLELLNIASASCNLQSEATVSCIRRSATEPYYQTFHLRHGFLPDLSILDLLFNEGPEAILYLS